MISMKMNTKHYYRKSSVVTCNKTGVNRRKVVASNNGYSFKFSLVINRHSGCFSVCRKTSDKPPGKKLQLQ
jgi:hypothetical protein